VREEVFHFNEEISVNEIEEEKGERHLYKCVKWPSMCIYSILLSIEERNVCLISMWLGIMKVVMEDISGNQWPVYQPLSLLFCVCDYCQYESISGERRRKLNVQ